MLTQLITMTLGVAAFKLLPNWGDVVAPTVRHLYLAGPDWTAEEAAAIRDAAAEWTSACPQTIHVWNRANETELAHIEPGDFKSVIMRTGFGGSTTLTAALTLEGILLSDTDIQLMPELWGEQLFNVALHEFGHVLGLGHSHPGNVMGYILKFSRDGAVLPAQRVRLTMDDIYACWAASGS